MNNVSLSTLATTSFGPANSTWSGVASGPLSSIGYRMTFTLGAKSTAVFTGYWEGQVIPTPGAFAMLAAAGGLANRRRRTN